MQTQKGVTAGDSRGAGQGTWIHPKVAISFAQWASAEFVAAVTVGSGTAPQAKKSKEWAVVAFSATTGADGKSRPVTNELVKVPFHGEMLESIKDDRGVWAGLKCMCENLGLNWSGQLRRLRTARWATMCMMHTVASDGKTREVAMLRADKIPMWLAGVDLDRIKDKAVRDKIDAYQDKAADVLAEHFFRPEPKSAPGLTAADVADVVVQTLAAGGASGVAGE
ncbi:phage antirepressor N-terminal domain-containing protein [Frigoriglobus tundricola]|uniref:phage antirepressor N-terminal domain-containing protein n=1 Tax=Frigoriglobus tundricola TaxID=2774151 RepID=UPI00187216E1|nr:phage antirepressor N-terminal domain-containing protein [Frigoriglobus tundricola]